MIPFDRCWPYETVGDDVYVSQCPFCRRANVLLPLKKEELDSVRGGRKRLLVFPCCHGRMKLVDADPDYLLADARLPRR